MTLRQQVIQNTVSIAVGKKSFHFSTSRSSDGGSSLFCALTYILIRREFPKKKLCLPFAHTHTRARTQRERESKNFFPWKMQRRQLSSFFFVLEGEKKKRRRVFAQRDFVFTPRVRVCIKTSSFFQPDARVCLTFLAFFLKKSGGGEKNYEYYYYGAKHFFAA